MLILRHHFIVYVPSKDKYGRILRRPVINEMRRIVSESMRSKFTCFTATKSTLSLDGRTESVDMYKAFCTEPCHDKEFNSMYRMCVELKEIGHVDTIAMEFDGEMMLI